MPKKKLAHVKKNGKDGPKPNLVNESEQATQNGLGDALGFDLSGVPGLSGFPGTEQVSNPTTLFKNLRWFFISNFRQVLSEAYVELGLIQTICDLPVEDAMRGGLDIKSKQLEEDQIKELQVNMDRDGDLLAVAQAGKWTRLFGGAGVIILTDQDPELPLEVNAIGPDTPLEFRPVDMWELFWDKQNTEGYDPSTQTHDFEYYNYYGEKLHKSRVMQMKGLEAPSFLRPRLRGWGFSVVEKLVRSINQYLKATDLGFEVLDEFKLDVYKIKNLVNTLLSPNGDANIKKRVQMANWQKNYQNAIVMDSEDDFDHKQLSFAGLAETMAGIRMQVASDMRMPITKLFGQSVSSGMGNTDQNDMENYNSMVEAEVRNKIKYDILRVCEIKCQKLFGFIPDDLEISFKPLRVLTAEQEENVKTQKFARLMQAKTAGEITTYEFREACNKASLLDITLDNSGDTLNPDDPEVETLVTEGAQDPEASADESGPGTNREDSQKGKVEKPEKKENDASWEEGKHPRAGDGKFGSGGAKAPEEIDKQISDLYDQAEKAEDGNSHHKAEAFREKARQLEKSKKKKKNSPEFDRASYEADGGDAWIDPRRSPLFENPANIDGALWAKAKAASQAALGEIKWQFVTWWYKKQGGKFS